MSRVGTGLAVKETLGSAGNGTGPLASAAAKKEEERLEARGRNGANNMGG